MKSRTLITITAAIITTAALLLTTGLSLLHSSAFDNATLDEVPVVDQAPVTDNGTDDEIEAEIGDTTSDEAPVEPEAPVTPEAPITPEVPVTPPVVNEIETPEITPPAYSYPDYEYTVVSAEDIHYCGCEQKNPHTAHYDLLRGVTIDVYSHKTGELVGQLAIESKEIDKYISLLMRNEFDPWAQTFEPDNGEEAVNLPNGDYRIEVYAGTWFSYTYGVHGIYELTQCTLTFYGGEMLTGYIDYLIADYIAEIEAGNVEKPNPETAVSKLEYGGLEGYWEGHWVEGNAYMPGYWSEGAGRSTERFPYVEE